MLQIMRDHFQGYVAWIIVGLVCITFAIWGIHNYESGGHKSAVAAVVNGHKILDTTWKTTYRNVQQQQMQQQGGNYNPTPAETKGLKKSILDQLITQQVLLHAATTAGYDISSSDVKQFLHSLPAFQVNGKYSESRVMQALRANNMTISDLYQHLYNQLLINQMQAGLILSDFALPNETQNVIRLVGQRRDISYLLITAQQFAKHIHIKPQQARAYYNAHKQAFMVPLKIQLAYIDLSVNELAKRMTFTDQALHAYYAANTDHFSSPSRRRVAQILIQVAPNAKPAEVAKASTQANAIYHQLQQGAKFATLAKTQSDDIATKNKGGDLGWWQANNPFGPTFNQAVAKLNQLGDVSPPFRSKYGFSIVKLTDMQAAKQLAFAKVKHKVREALAQEKAQQQFPELSERLADLSYQHSDSLESVAKALDLPIKTTPLFSKKGGNTPLTQDRNVLRAAFSPQVIKERYNSELIQLNDSEAVVVRLAKRQDAHIPSFASVKKQVEAKLIAKQSKAQAQALGKKVVAALHRHDVKRVKQLAQQAHLTWHHKKHITRMTEMVAPLISSMAFKAPKPSKARPSIQAKALDNGDYVVVAVSAVHAGSKKYNQQKRESYGQILAQSSGELSFMLYQQQLRQQAKITLDDQSFLQD